MSNYKENAEFVAEEGVAACLPRLFRSVELNNKKGKRIKTMSMVALACCVCVAFMAKDGEGSQLFNETVCIVNEN